MTGRRCTAHPSTASEPVFRVSSLLQALPQALGTKAKWHLEGLFDWALPACLRFVRKELQEISPTEDAGLARGTMRIIEACLDDFREGASCWPGWGGVNQVSGHLQHPTERPAPCVWRCFPFNGAFVVVD